MEHPLNNYHLDELQTALKSEPLLEKMNLLTNQN